MLKLENGTFSFYQWDLDQRFIVTEINGPASIHFWQDGLTDALAVDPYEEDGQTMADVPNILLQKASPITAYIYREDIGAYTSYKRIFQVYEREKPAGYVYTETEARTWEALDKRIKELEENGAGGITIDAELSTTSTNPVQNKVVAGEIDGIKKDIYSKENGLQFAVSLARDATDAAATAQQTANTAGAKAHTVQNTLDYDVKPRLETLENTAVLCTEQTLTPEQQAQARKNIGAGTGGGGTADPYNDYQPDVPENIGVLNAILNFKQIAEVPIVAKKTIPQHKGDFTPQAQPYYGIPYSSSRIEEGFVPNFVSLETFMTALQNENSYLYTVDLGELGNINGDAYYGSVCSVACAYALNIEPNYPTHQWQDIPDMEMIPWQSVHALKLGDTICHHTSGHVVMVTDITRNKRGKIGTITISEARYRSVLHNPPRTPEEIAELYPTDQYGYFRYNKIHEVQHTQSPFVAVEDETPMEFPYNTTLIPRKGDKANWLQGVPVEIDLLETANYTTAEIYKDDVLYDTVAIKGAERPVDRTVYGLGWYALDSKMITTTYIPSTDIMVSVADGVKAKIVFNDAALVGISNTSWRTEPFSTEGIVPDGAKGCRVVLMLPDESEITDIDVVASKIGVSILPDTDIMPLVLVGNGLSSTDGTETDNKSTRLRSGFQPLQNVVIAGGNDVQYYLYFYDANKAYIGNNGAWLTGTINVLDVAPSGTAYYRLLVKNNAGTSISTQNGIYAQEFTLTILGGVPDGELDVLVLDDLPYGSYKVRLTDGTNHSEWCYWIVVDAVCSAVSNGAGSRQATVTFSASNAEPLFVKWAGGVDNGTKHINPLTDDEKAAGTATVKYETAFSDGQNNTYKMRVGFKTEYGIIHTPLPEAITV